MSFMQRIQSTLGMRGVRYGANASAMTILFIAIMVLSNILAVRFHTRYDLTAQKEFSISHTPSGKSS